MAPYARRTHRLTAALKVLGLANGRKPGVRMACQLGLPMSSDTLLRQVQRLLLDLGQHLGSGANRTKTICDAEDIEPKGFV